MTRKQFRSKCKELKRQVSQLIDNRIEKILNSGCIDLPSAPDDYALPKAFMSAIGGEIKFQFKPHTKENQEISKNIELFL
jgi:hypothetical protein